ncbi:class I adenylate-forming enzyme family protein [Roseovarius sp. A46]|uniref:class I adenylate-forming enzyme family protein n=1 Tax=Roseovarius sp. A46 TaxID=2109331 RepID=UPI0019D6FBEA|nr:class I adenylate-forming enzyme family protein [Roseovarius sp. A46]
MTRDNGAADQNILTRLGPAMLAEQYAAGFWSDDTLYSLTRANAEAAPDRVAIRDSHCALSYAEMMYLADRIGAELIAAGLRPGDRVAAWLSNRVELAPLLLACSGQGLVLCPSLHRNHTVAEIATLAQRMRARVLVTEVGHGADAGQASIAEAVAGQAHLIRHVELPAPVVRGPEDIRRMLAPGDGAPPGAAGHADDIVYLAFTSGTSGEPKGVLHSNNTLLANARALARDWEFDDTSVIYSLSPLSHNLGFGALVLSLLAGGTMVLHDAPRGVGLLDRIRECAVSFLFGVPAHAMDLVAEIDRRGAGDLGTLKGFRISGAAVSEATVEKLMAHGVVPQSGYGMTEGCSHHYTLPDDPKERILGSSGTACAGYEVRIFDIDDPDRPLATGETGHIGGRGASLMLGYFGDQEATERAFNRQGWFMTGDLGVLDGDGYLRVTGRIKEIIIRGGHNIQPALIERLAMRHPALSGVAVVPVADDRLGERVCIVVSTDAETGIEPADLLAHLAAEGLSRYDMPEYFLRVPELPTSANGKVLKRHLVAAIAAGDLQPVSVR